VKEKAQVRYIEIRARRQIQGGGHIRQGGVC